ncbi:MAG: gamma-glutamylcyclotransferase [Trueperaceae bacterium]|nr:MAG: gamma-glutamylcyclotransferase [Trueperaceae bacterium]
MRYFAYGSNLDWDQMRERCPSSAFVHVARLSDHALAFTRYSPTRGCGVADVVHRNGHDVWGVVYDLSDADGYRLDAFEGYVPGRRRNGYRRLDTRVAVDGDEARAIEVVTYEVCERRTTHVPPDRRYLGHLLRGARHWGLPQAYQTALHDVALV